MKPVIQIKRVYEEPQETDGFRILIDRLWPRGETKEKAAIDEWAKELAPSDELRKWFGHDPALWTEFQKRYRSELDRNTAVHEFAAQHKNKKRVTLVYAAKDTEHTHALVLQQYLGEIYKTL